MDKREYFLHALRAEASLYKSWVLSTFTVLHHSAHAKLLDDPHPYHLTRSKQDDKTVYFKDPNSDEWGVIEGASWDKAIFEMREPLHLEPGDLPNVKEAVDTTYGNALFNAMVLVYAFGDKVAFKTGRIKGNDLIKEITAKLKDTPDDPNAERDPTCFYVDELLKHNNAVTALSGYAGVLCPAATEKTMSVNPEILKERDKLLKEYKDQLHDPAIIAMIEKKLVDMDKAWFEGDAGKDFYIKDKTYAVSRKRCFLMFGMETGFDTGKAPKLITSSLRDGWDLDSLPDMVETARAGSYNRGHETALGGESVKYFYRIFQNTRVLEDDCGTTKGVVWKVTAENYKRFTGIHPLKAGSKSEGFTGEKLKGMIGETIVVRSPLYCKTKAPSFCAKCVGDLFASNPTGLHIAVSDVGSRFLYVFMLAMHGKALRTAEYRITQVFS
jgi:hypothetical protein